MSPRPWLLAALGLLIGCASRPVAGSRTCAPARATLQPGTTATSLAGEHRVRLVATSGPRRGSSTDGTLTLRRVDPATPDSATRRFVLRGSGNLSLSRVGAVDADVASRDPLRPGILVFDLGPGPQAAPGPRVLLRLGAEANRQDVARVEGAYTVLLVHEVGKDGFRGEWRSGAPLPVAEGYFCAWRSGPAHE